MKTTVDCLHCYLRQSVNCMRNAEVSENDQPAVIYELMDLIKTLDINRTPCYNATYAIRKTYEMIGNADPFRAEKNQSNEAALQLLKKLEKTIDMDDLQQLLVLSSAGNIIDSGIIFEYDMEKTMSDTLGKGFSINHYRLLTDKLSEKRSILYLGDNCGEVVFDMPAIRFLAKAGHDVHYAVKSAPILNDALREDALFARIHEYADIIETGSGFLGVNEDDSSDEFLDLLENADIIISKGQANFESIDDRTDAAGRIFFILKIKCDCIADSIPGSSYGDSVLYTKGCD